MQDAADVFANSHDFNGVIAVAVAGRQTMAQTYGFSDVRSRNPATLNFAYAIGSISKWFTAVLVLRLIEMGTLSLDTPLSTLLPEFPESGRRVTLNHLLSNTSGLPDLLMTAAKADSVCEHQPPQRGISSIALPLSKPSSNPAPNSTTLS